MSLVANLKTHFFGMKPIDFSGKYVQVRVFWITAQGMINLQNESSWCVYWSLCATGL